MMPLSIVNDQFTVTFDGASIKPIGSQKPLLGRNTFKWTEEYGTFLSTSFEKGMQVGGDGAAVSLWKSKPQNWLLSRGVL